MVKWLLYDGLFLFSLWRGVRMILIGFKFHPGHQNAKYVCGDVNKKKGGGDISITDIAESISEPLACFSRICYFLFV